MKNNIICFFILPMCLLLSFACEDNRLDNIVDDTVYLLHEGLHEVKIGDNFQAESISIPVHLVKAGVGNREFTAEISIIEEFQEILDWDELQGYEVMSMDAFYFKNHKLFLSKKDYQSAFYIVVDNNKLLSSKDSKWVIPCRVKVLHENSSAEDIFDIYIVPVID